LAAQVADPLGAFGSRYDRAGAGMVGAIDQVFLTQHRNARHNHGARLQGADIDALPHGYSRQDDHHRLATLDTQTSQDIGDTIRLIANVGKGQPRAIAGLILPQ